MKPTGPPSSVVMHAVILTTLYMQRQTRWPTANSTVVKRNLYHDAPGAFPGASSTKIIPCDSPWSLGFRSLQCLPEIFNQVLCIFNPHRQPYHRIGYTHLGTAFSA